MEVQLISIKICEGEAGFIYTLAQCRKLHDKENKHRQGSMFDDMLLEGWGEVEVHVQ